MIPVSLLSTYSYCPRKLFLQKIMEVKEPEKASIVKGSIRHKFYDLINKSEEEIVKAIKEPTPFETIRETYTRNYAVILKNIIISRKNQLKRLNISLYNLFKQIQPSFVQESMARATNIFNFIQQHTLFGDELWQNLTPKIESEFYIKSEKLQLKGVIDRLECYKNTHIPIELKTGKIPEQGLWPSHKIQLSAYIMLLEDKFNIIVKEGFVDYLDHGQKRHLPINPFLKQEVTDTTKNILILLEERKIPDLCQNKKKCLSCGLKDICYKSSIPLKKHNI